MKYASSSKAEAPIQAVNESQAAFKVLIPTILN